MASRIWRSSMTKSFAQAGNFHGGADLAEIIERTLEKLFIRQNGKAACVRGFSIPWRFLPDQNLCKMISARTAMLFSLRQSARCRRRGFFQRGNKITPLAMLQHRVPQIAAGGDDSRAGNFATSRFFCSTILSKIFICHRDTENTEL